MINKIEHTKFKNYEVVIIRKQIKRCYIRVKRNSANQIFIQVTAPRYYSTNYIDKSINDASNFIEKRIKELSVSSKFNEEKLLDKDRLLKRTTFWENLMGLHASDYSIKKMKSRWGSCRKESKRISINAYLAQLDPKFLDYVIVHELAHLLEANHGPEFWAIVEKYYPNAKATQRELNKHNLR